MRQRELPSLKARLLFKVVDRLSGRGKEVALPPLQRQRTPAGGANYRAPTLDFIHLPPRTRCLTPPPFETQPELNPTTDEQIQSFLFRLPDEILLMIYREIVGDKLIHITRRQRKLGHKICRTNGDPDECTEERCRGLKLPSGTYVQSGKANSDSIRLLQTCRKIYADAIPLLYSSNIFDFDSMEGYISLSCAVLPHRFDSIQSVKMDFRFNLSLYFSETTCFNDWPRWERMWRVLSTMGSLQKLWVRISWPKSRLHDVEEKRYLKPLWLLKHVETFEVNLPPLKDEEKDWGPEVPFQIIRRGRVDAGLHVA